MPDPIHTTKIEWARHAALFKEHFIRALLDWKMWLVIVGSFIVLEMCKG